MYIGITGGIGSGKSTVAAVFATHGAVVIDADAIARQCTGPSGLAMPLIEQLLGSAYVDAHGALNRQHAREMAFGHPEVLKTLEAIIHPIVRQEMDRQSQSVSARCVAFDIPLLAESPVWRQKLDRVLVVDCTVETQVRRVMSRNAWSSEAVYQVIDQQCSRSMRLMVADDIIFNEAIGPQHLHVQVGDLFRYLGI